MVPYHHTIYTLYLVPHTISLNAENSVVLIGFSNVHVSSLNFDEIYVDVMYYFSERYGMVCYGMVWYGTIPGTTSMAWYGMVPYHHNAPK
jgi:hypothetical protein